MYNLVWLRKMWPRQSVWLVKSKFCCRWCIEPICDQMQAQKPLLWSGRTDDTWDCDRFCTRETSQEMFESCQPQEIYLTISRSRWPVLVFELVLCSDLFPCKAESFSATKNVIKLARFLGRLISCNIFVFLSLFAVSPFSKASAQSAACKILQRIAGGTSPRSTDSSAFKNDWIALVILLWIQIDLAKSNIFSPWINTS